MLTRQFGNGLRSAIYQNRYAYIKKYQCIENVYMRPNGLKSDHKAYEHNAAYMLRIGSAMKLRPWSPSGPLCVPRAEGRQPTRGWHARRHPLSTSRRQCLLEYHRLTFLRDPEVIRLVLPLCIGDWCQLARLGPMRLNYTTFSGEIDSQQSQHELMEPNTTHRDGSLHSNLASIVAAKTYALARAWSCYQLQAHIHRLVPAFA